MLYQVVVKNNTFQGNEYFRAMTLTGTVEVSEYDV